MHESFIVTFIILYVKNINHINFVEKYAKVFYFNYVFKSIYYIIFIVIRESNKNNSK